MAPLSANDVVDIRKALATAVTANRTDEIKRHLLRLRQELVASEELLRVRSRSFCCTATWMLKKRGVQDTKIGLSVGKLRQYSSKEVADIAKDIVKKVRFALHTSV